MTNYPTSIDTDVELYLVADNIDNVMAVHHNAEKDAIIAIQTALGITGAFNFALTSHTQALSSITDPVGNTTWSLSNESLKLQFPNDIGGGMDGGLEIEAIGIFTGDLVHIHQHTGAVGAVTLLHVEGVDTDVTPVKIVGTGANSLDVTGNVAVSGTVDGVDIGDRDHDPTVAGDLNHNDLANIDAGDINHLTDAQVTALHTAVVAGDLNHNDLANINAGDTYEHISATQLAALHTIVVAGDLNHNDLANIDADDIKHITAAQLGALHAVVTTLTHTALTGKNDEVNIKHLTDAQQTALHAAVVAGDLNHNDLANINAGDNYEHITQTQKNALHADAHALATSGPHTGTLPLTDLVAGTAGSLIMRGAADWEELLKGAAIDTDVLTLVSGYPAWVAQGAPGVHDIITGHNDTGLTIGDVITATGAATFAWQTPSAYDADLMIGSANSKWIPCALHMVGAGEWALIRYLSESAIITQNSTFDSDLVFLCPLPTNRGGLKLYVKGTRVGLSDADDNDYVNSVYVFGINYDYGLTIKGNSIDLKTILDHIYNWTAEDCSTYSSVIVELRTANSTDYELDIQHVMLDCYYDT